MCQIHTPKCKGVATTVDHIVPVATAKQNGLTPMETNSLMNLRAACTACNYSLGQRAKAMKIEEPSVAGIKLTASEQQTLNDMAALAEKYQRGEIQRETWFNPIWFQD